MKGYTKANYSQFVVIAEVAARGISNGGGGRIEISNVDIDDMKIMRTEFEEREIVEKFNKTERLYGSHKQQDLNKERIVDAR